MSRGVVPRRTVQLQGDPGALKAAFLKPHGTVSVRADGSVLRISEAQSLGDETAQDGRQAAGRVQLPNCLPQELEITAATFKTIPFAGRYDAFVHISSPATSYS